MMDIVVPKGNERELLAMAERLGWDGLVLAYHPKDLPAALPDSRLKLRAAVFVPARDIQRWHGKAWTIAMAEYDQERQAVEAGPDAILGLEGIQQKDTMHARVSGFNQVLAALAKRRGVALCVSLAELLALRGVRRAQVLGRIAQNVMLCRKAGVRMVLSSFASTPEGMRSAHDLMALGRVLGMTPAEAQAALQP